MATGNRTDIESGAVEAADLEAASANAPKHGFFVRLYTGTGGWPPSMPKRRRNSFSGLSSCSSSP